MEMEGNFDIYDIILLTIGILVTIVGIIQIYFIQTNVSRDHSIKFMVINLCLADLMDGLVMLFSRADQKNISLLLHHTGYYLPNINSKS